MLDRTAAAVSIVASQCIETRFLWARFAPSDGGKAHRFDAELRLSPAVP